MSEEERGLSSSEWLRAQLEALRKQLDRGEVPEGLADLLADLREAGGDAGSEREDEAMFSLALDAALKGVDIRKRYPKFFRQLLASPEARRDFLDALANLEASGEGVEPALTASPSSDLRFLERPAPPAAEMEMKGPGRWQLSWRRNKEDLQSLFSSFFLAPGYRDLDSLLEDAQLTLIDEEATVEGMQLTVLLGAIRPLDKPGALLPSLIVSGQGQQPLQATLAWGSYHETVRVHDGLMTFPLLPLAAITEGGGQAVVAGLHFALTAQP